MRLPCCRPSYVLSVMADLVLVWRLSEDHVGRLAYVLEYCSYRELGMGVREHNASGNLAPNLKCFNS